METVNEHQGPQCMVTQKGRKCATDSSSDNGSTVDNGAFGSGCAS